MYGIDFGETDYVDVNDIYKLPPDLENVPPLCFRAVLPSWNTTPDFEEFSSFDKNCVYLCRIGKILVTEIFLHICIILT